jgi:hypothetical protein
MAPLSPSARDKRTSVHGSSPVPASVKNEPASIFEALKVIPTCERVYSYTVPESSEWTTTDLLHALNAMVSSAPPQHRALDNEKGTA